MSWLVIRYCGSIDCKNDVSNIVGVYVYFLGNDSCCSEKRCFCGFSVLGADHFYIIKPSTSIEELDVG